MTNRQMIVKEDDSQRIHSLLMPLSANFSPLCKVYLGNISNDKSADDSQRIQSILKPLPANFSPLWKVHL